jgi:hypothetical protein
LAQALAQAEAYLLQCVANTATIAESCWREVSVHEKLHLKRTSSMPWIKTLPNMLPRVMATRHCPDTIVCTLYGTLKATLMMCHCLERLDEDSS